MSAEALKAREEIVLPVRSGEGGEVVLLIAGKDTATLVTQDEGGRMYQETISIIEGADRIETFLAKMREAAPRDAEGRANVVTLLR